MPGPIQKGRPSKGPRLFLRPATENRKAVYVIRDGSCFRSTGCGPENRSGAEEALQAYLAEKHNPRVGERDPDAIPLADVINLYLTDVAPGHVRPGETADRLTRILSFEGWKTLGDVNGGTCRAYTHWRGKPYAARREMEDMRAAINYHFAEGQANRNIRVTLPPKPAPRDRWLTRGEVARLLNAAWFYREQQQGKTTKKRSRKHLAKFILVALYTGTRSGAVTAASFEREEGRGFIDLETGMFYRAAPGERQTKKRKPAIRLPERLLVHLRLWRKNGQRYVIEHQGRPVDTVKRAFPRVVESAGLGREVTAHVLRHTAATWAMMNGTDPWDASDYLGMSLQTLEDTYGHHHPDRSARAGLAIARRPVGTEMAQKIPSNSA